MSSDAFKVDLRANRGCIRLFQDTEQSRKDVLGFVLRRIASENSANLVKSCVKWPPVEVQLFVVEVLACVPHKFHQLTKYVVTVQRIRMTWTEYSTAWNCHAKTCTDTCGAALICQHALTNTVLWRHS